MTTENKNAGIVWRPQPRQMEFMRRPEPEALYGGAAGGGKSDALVIEALRQVHIPHYRALILRKTYPQLSDLVDKSQSYYRRAFPEAQYNATSHVWVFPSGAKIYFGSMQYTKDRTNYQGKAFDFIGFDELTHFEWEEYSYMMSRNRPTGPGTRVYLRATTNPGGVGHGWVKARFITPAPPGTPIVEEYPVRMPDGTEKVLRRARVFVPSSIFDNPALLENDPDYLASLAAMPEAEKQALLYGSWDLIAMVKAISAAASVSIPAGETTWGAVFIANGLQLILAILLIVLGLNIVFHSLNAYKKAEKNSEAKV